MAETGRVDGEVTPVELGMVATESNQLHVGETEPDRIHSNKQLIRSKRTYVDVFWPALTTDALDSSAVRVPAQVAA